MISKLYTIISDKLWDSSLYFRHRYNRWLGVRVRVSKSAERFRWLLRSYVFVCCQQITFKRDNFTKRALSSRVDGFSLTYPRKSWKEKKTWRGLFELPGTLALVNLVSRSIRPLWFLVRPGTDAARRFHLLLHHRSQYFHFGTWISDVCG